MEKFRSVRVWSTSPPPVYTPRVLPKPGVLYENIKPILFVLRVVGVIPVQISAQGRFIASICSFSALYSVVVFVGLGYLVILLGYGNLVYISTSSRKFDDIVWAILMLTFLVPHLVLPMRWWEAPAIARYMNQWFTFESKFQQVTTRSLKMNCRRYIIVVMVLMITAFITFMLLYKLIMQSITTPWIDFVYTNYVFISTTLQAFLWYYMCVAFKKAAEQMREAYLQEKFLSGTIIEQYRCLWLELQSLMADTGQTLCYTFIVLMLWWFCIIVLSLYALLVEFLNNGFEGGMLAFVVLVMMCWMSLFYICQGAEMAKKAASGVFHDPAQKIFVSYLPEVQMQLKLLDQAIRINPPIISLGNYFNVDCGALTTTLTTVASYLIILVQFKLNSNQQKPQQS